MKLLKLIKNYFYNFFIIFVALLSIFGPNFSVFATDSISDSVLEFNAKNNQLYYNPNQDPCINLAGGTTTTVTGDTNEDKIWNYFVNAGIEGFSNNIAAIAGAMGNIQQESNFQPYATSGQYIGLVQWGNDRNQTIKSQLSALGYGNYWHRDNSRPNIPEAAIDAAIQIELDWLFQESQFKKFVEGIGKTNNQTGVAGAESYSDLWLVVVEGAHASSAVSQHTGKSNALIDSYAKSQNTRYVYWQEAENRREYAAQIYQKYSNYATSGNTSTKKEDGSNVLIIGDSITVRSENDIKELLPKATINAKVGRTFKEGVEILKSQKSNLKDIIVFALGSNDDTITEDLAREVLQIAGNDRQVIFVTNYSLGKHDYDQHNTLFNALSTQNDNVVIADWASAVSDEPTKFIAEEDVDVHPTTGEGTKLFAQTIYDAISSDSVQSVNNNYCSPYGGGTWNSSDFPTYLQCDERWGSYRYGTGGINGKQGTSICDSGCGPSSFAMMATVLLGREVFPSETADIAGKAGMHVTDAGSSWEITNTLAKHYGLQYQDFGTSRNSCINVINNALNDGWMIHTSGAGSKPFSNGGHYIGIVGIDNNGNWLIVDSSHGNASYAPSAVVNAGLKCDNLKGIRK